MAQVTGAPSVDYALSAMILAGGSIGNPDYVPQNYQIFLLSTLIMLIHGCISSMPTKWIARFNSVGSTFNIIALCIVIILIPASTNREDQGLPKFTDSGTVWGNFYEGTNFPQGVSLLMTFVAVIWTMRCVMCEGGVYRANHYPVVTTRPSILAKNAPMPTSQLQERLSSQAGSEGSSAGFSNWSSHTPSSTLTRSSNQILGSRGHRTYSKFCLKGLRSLPWL